MDPILRLEQRLRGLKFRLKTRAWELRQYQLAKGAWLRLGRVLAEAEQAYLITAEDAALLEREGYEAEPVGREFEPPKWLGFVSRERAEAASGWHPIELRRSPALVSAQYLALVRFPPEVT
jgi:hypothetical protein